MKEFKLYSCNSNFDSYMSICILIFLLISVVFFIYRRRARLLKELEEKSQAFQEQINIFFNEYNGFQKQYISDSERKVFTSKWENLYSEIRQYKIPQKNPYYESIEKFTHTYKNINKVFDDINNEFQRKAYIKLVSQDVSQCMGGQLLRTAFQNVWI